MIDQSALDMLVVDRRPQARNPAVADAVRTQRRRLMAESLPDETSAERLLEQTGRRAYGHCVVMLILVSILGVLGVFVLGGATPLLWAGVTAVLYLALASYLRRHALRSANPGQRGQPAPGATETIVQTLHIPIAAAWAWFALLGCEGPCLSDMAVVFRANGLLVAMATSALMLANVRLSVLIAFLPAAIVVAFHSPGGSPAAGMGMAAIVSLGLGFFVFVAARMRGSAMATLRLSFEKDALIGELETAKAISDSARHRAEEANMAKSRFLASMSHELRTPLNAIMGFSEVMRDEILGPVGNDTYREYVDDIHRSGRHLLSLINEILDLSRVEAGRYPLDFQPHPLEDIARSAIETLRVKAGQKGLKVTTRFERDLPDMVVDERAMRQCMLNLLANAIKFTPHNGHIDVSVGPTAGGGQYVTVSDNGPGIPQEELPLVLSAFGQGSIALKHAEEGTGLGLAIVQALVGRHDGRFLLASALRRGTRATITLPRERVDGVAAVGPSEPDPADETAARATA